MSQQTELRNGLAGGVGKRVPAVASAAMQRLRNRIWLVVSAYVVLAAFVMLAGLDWRAGLLGAAIFSLVAALAPASGAVP